jgi:glucokinase
VTTNDLVLGVDVGGTKVAVGVATTRGEVRSIIDEPTRAGEGPDAIINRLVELAHRAVAEAGTGLEHIAAIGIGCGGPLDPARGVILDPPNLPGWTSVPLRERLEHGLGRTAHLANDADAAALGEHRFGAGRGVDNLVYVTISTGIGGGAIVGGSLLMGESGNATEIGHMSVNIDGWACQCGRSGCPEAFASGTNIARRAREALAAGEASVLAKAPTVSAREVADAARAGDPLALRVWDETVEVLGAMIANVLNVFNPRLVILGGGVARAGDLLFEPVRRLAAAQVLGPQAHDAAIVPAELGERTGILGAVAVALEHIEGRARLRELRAATA